MPNAEIPVPSAEMQRRLAIADVQLIPYTHETERSTHAEGQKASKFTAANQPLPAYTRNLRMAFNAKRSMTKELEQVFHDTLHNRRPYKPAFDPARTCDIILNGGGRR
jgi:hypothetical protein